MKYVFTLIFVFTIWLVEAQNKIEKEHWCPVFDSNLPMRVFTLKMEGLFQYSINSTSDISKIGNGKAEISGTRFGTIGVKYPILNGTKAILSGSFKYTDEQFYFSDFEPSDYPLYTSLNDRNLKTLGGDLNGIFRLRDNRSILMRSSFNLAGDFYRINESFAFGDLLKISMALGYGIKKDRNTYLGFGAYLGYTFGKPSIYPAFVFNKRYANGVGLDFALPQSIRGWKKFSDKFYLFGRSKIVGNSYTVRLNGAVLGQYERLQLRQSNILSSVGIYQRLGKWIWLEGEVGYSHNLNFNISESNFASGGSMLKPDTNYIIKSKLSGAPFVGLSVFMAPTREFLDRMSSKF